jgi:hypothetical protein
VHGSVYRRTHYHVTRTQIGDLYAATEHGTQELFDLAAQPNRGGRPPSSAMRLPADDELDRGVSVQQLADEAFRDFVQQGRRRR